MDFFDAVRTVHFKKRLLVSVFKLIFHARTVLVYVQSTVMMKCYILGLSVELL